MGFWALNTLYKVMGHQRVLAHGLSPVINVTIDRSVFLFIYMLLSSVILAFLAHGALGFIKFFFVRCSPGVVGIQQPEGGMLHIQHAQMKQRSY